MNENKPTLTAETLPIRGLIVRLKASDKDLGENANITYHFTARQPETLLKPFTLYKHSGELRLASSLESSAGKSFELLTEARDNGNPSLTEQVRVHIHVLDTHNNPPEIHVNTFSTSGSAEVSESSTVGRAVAHIGVHDPDSGANGVVNCSIAHDYITISQLDVNEYKGILSKPLDREKISQHSVIVVCYDSGSPRLTTSVSFQVKVLDENDNPPVFLQSVYYASFTENNFIPQYVTTVSAVDYDAGSNAEIAYKLIGDNKDDFKILSNGTLSAIRQFDREASPLVIVKIEASDSGQKRLTSTVNVEITLEDLNDKRPEFKHSVFYFNVSENMLTRNDVGQIEAFDRDENENAALVFSMGNPANGATPFTITPAGMVQTTKTLDRESTNRYVISVVATDMGEPPLSSSVQVVVTVNDMNDQSPVILYPNDENNTHHLCAF
ncbi:protocadherin-9-like [Patella vulgata]|uniref:protocadherin-9-like n=1 Tax=Patella vulgata TaxID=6465 RepID=UPI0024A81D0F|nr:protocadherin-9-like [Patella vulgata]